MEEDPIQVHCRIKPGPSLLRVDHSNGTVWSDQTHSCRFHHVFGPEASQVSLVAKLGRLLSPA